MQVSTLKAIIEEFNATLVVMGATMVAAMCDASNAKAFNELHELQMKLNGIRSFIEWAGGGVVRVHDIEVLTSEKTELAGYALIAVVHNGKTGAYYNGSFSKETGEWVGQWIGNAPFERRCGVTRKARTKAVFRSEKTLLEYRDLGGGDLGRGWEWIKLENYVEKS